MRRDKLLGPCMVSNLLLIIANPRQHCVGFDNFFTSDQLLVDLKGKRFRMLETIRENRLMKCPMIASKAAQKKERGFCDSYFDKNIVLVRWNDNRVVHMASNFVGV